MGSDFLPIFIYWANIVYLLGEAALDINLLGVAALDINLPGVAALDKFFYYAIY